MALAFDSSGTQGLSSAANLPVVTSFTACGWAYRTASNVSNESFFGLGPHFQVELQYGRGGAFTITTYDGVSTSNIVAAASRPATATWFFWYVRCSGAGAGLLQAGWCLPGANSFTSCATTLVSTDATTGIVLGKSGGDFLDGRMSGTKVWDAALTDAELLAESRTIRPQRFANLNRFTPQFDASLAGSLLDYGGAGASWTAVATPTVGDGPPISWGAGSKVVNRGAGAQTLTPSLFTNSQTFYVPTVTPGAVTLTPGLFSNTNTFYSPTVSQGGSTQTLTPSLFTNSNTFYAATVTRGAVTLSPSLFTNSSTFYASTVTRGTITLTPGLFTSSPTFYAPTVTRTNTLAPALFTNSSTFYAPTVTRGAVTLSPALFANASTFYPPTVFQPGGLQTLLPSLFTNLSVFYAPSVSNDNPAGVYPESLAGGGVATGGALRGGASVSTGRLTGGASVVANSLRGF